MACSQAALSATFLLLGDGLEVGVRVWTQQAEKCRLEVLTRSRGLHCWAGTRQSQPWQCPAKWHPEAPVSCCEEGQ